MTVSAKDQLLFDGEQALKDLTTELLAKYIKWYNEKYGEQLDLFNVNTEEYYINKNVNRIMREMDYSQRLYSIVGDMTHGGIQEGVGFLLQKRAFNKKWFTNKYKGHTLSERLNNSTEELRRTISELTTQRLKAKTNYREVLKDLTNLNVSARSKLPKVYRDLESTIETLGIDSDDAKDLLKIAKAQSKKLKIDPTEFGDLKRSYEKVQKSIAKGDLKGFKANLKKAKQVKIDSNNLRIATSELNRAYDDGFNVNMLDRPEITGYQFLLSSSHAIVDICDVYANVNYGLGRGVFPKDQIILLPIHPNGKSTKVPVFKDLKTSNFNYSKNVMKDAIEKLPIYKQQEILGINAQADKSKWNTALDKKGYQTPQRGSKYKELGAQLNKLKVKE